MTLDIVAKAVIRDSLIITKTANREATNAVLIQSSRYMYMYLSCHFDWSNHTLHLIKPDLGIYNPLIKYPNNHCLQSLAFTWNKITC